MSLFMSYFSPRFLAMSLYYVMESTVDNYEERIKHIYIYIVHIYIYIYIFYPHSF